MPGRESPDFLSSETEARISDFGRESFINQSRVEVDKVISPAGFSAVGEQIRMSLLGQAVPHSAGRFLLGFRCVVELTSPARFVSRLVIRFFRLFLTRRERSMVSSSCSFATLHGLAVHCACSYHTYPYPSKHLHSVLFNNFSH